MITNVLWMGASTFARLGSGFLVFVVIARWLGPSEFGRYMYWFAATYVASLIANFGLSNLLLREIGQSVDRLIPLISDALSARLMLSICLLASAGVVALSVSAPTLLLVLLAANLLEVLAETLFVGFRSSAFYSVEAFIATAFALAQLVIVTLTALIWAEAETIAIAYCAGRLAQFIAVMAGVRRTLGPVAISPIKKAFALLTRSRSYALDFVLGNLFGQIDSMVLKAYVGVGGVGIYQSGMRIFQGGAQLAPILANVFLPAAARASTMTGALQARAGERVQIVFLVCGASFGLLLGYGADFIVRIVFGEDFRDLSALLPLFGLLFFVRFLAAAWGLLLTAKGCQRFRACSTAIQLVVAMLLAVCWVPAGGVGGWLWSLITANLLLAVLYLVGALRYGAAQASRTVFATAIVGGLSFVPLLGSSAGY